MPMSKTRIQLIIENIVIQTPYSILPKKNTRIGTIRRFKKILIALNIMPNRIFFFELYFYSFFHPPK